MDETRIDAAPTPAHVFAYRAFRSVFVPSPESSPLQPRGYDHEQDHDKENTRRSPARPSRFATSPIKAKRKDGEVNALGLEHDLKLTPKKQRTVPVSPTKSILKNPHAPTPKRAGLRDVTVTFKDVRKSRSPELLRQAQGSPVQLRSQPAMRTLLEDMAKQKPAATVEISTGLPTSMQPSGFDLDAYKAQTEKEMRRLIKYGQKWKEQAKRQDEENANLRTLLEETRRENQRLQKKISQMQQLNEAKVMKTTDAATTKENATANRTRTHDPRSTEGYSANRQPQRETTSEHRPAATRRSSLQQKLHELQHLQPSPPTALNERAPNANAKTKTKDQQPRQQQRPPSLQKKVDLLKQATSEQERSSLHKAQADREKDTKEATTATATATATALEPTVGDEVQKVSLPLRTVSLSIAEDKKVAARERLRVKREARAASSQAALSVVPVTTKESKLKKVNNPSKVDVDESQVDWLAMA